MEWINTPIHTTWVNVGELPDIVSKWYTYAELTQVVRELGTKQSMFNRNTRGPDDQRFTGGMWDAILNNTLSASYIHVCVYIYTHRYNWIALPYS